MSNSDNMYKISLNLSQKEFEVEGEKSFVEKWVPKLEKKINSVSKNNDSSKNRQSSGQEKEKSIAEIYDREKFSKKQDRVLFIGWALEVLRDNEEFTKPQIKDVAQEFKIELGANLTRDIKSLIKKGKIKKIGEENGETTYYLTRTGEQFVEEKI